jgi:TPR repeat protein
MNILQNFLYASATLLFVASSFAQDKTSTGWNLDDLKFVASELAASGDANGQGILSIFIQEEIITGTNDEAYSLAKKSATASSAFGIYALARCYDKGVGTKKDDGKSQPLYEKAFNKLKIIATEYNDGTANHYLGVCYSLGRGVSEDNTEAMKWYRKAAEQGLALSQFSLGCMYLDGEGVSQDYEEAVKWFSKAAEQGLAAAQYNIGCMYGNGQGVSQDYEEAMKWFRRAAQQGLAEAIEALKRTTPKDSIAIPSNVLASSESDSDISSSASTDSKTSTDDTKPKDLKKQLIGYWRSVKKSDFSDAYIYQAFSEKEYYDVIGWIPYKVIEVNGNELIYAWSQDGGALGDFDRNTKVIFHSDDKINISYNRFSDGIAYERISEDMWLSRE